jgi:hypothetical protein
VAKHISACLADISAWKSDDHLKLNLDKMELFFLPGKACPLQDLSIMVDNFTVFPFQSVKEPWRDPGQHPSLQTSKQ